ncbi:MAG: hypothetical protein RSA21_09830 [Akkermansia sp.]
MISLPYPIRKVIPLTCCGSAILLFAACGGNGVGAPESPVGYIFLFNSKINTSGETGGINDAAGLVSVVPTSRHEGLWIAATMTGSQEMVKGQTCVYLRTGANSFTYSLAGRYIPPVAPSVSYRYQANVIMDKIDSKGQEVSGTMKCITNVSEAAIEGDIHNNREGDGTALYRTNQ